MKQSEAAQWAALFQAFADGKTVLFYTGSFWRKSDHIDSTLELGSYRIKPEPREWWEVLSDTSSLLGRTPRFNSREEACDYAHTNYCRYGHRLSVIKVREVLDEN